MKQTILIICFLAFLQYTSAQNDSNSTDFIRETVTTQKDSINYLDHLDKYYLNEIGQALNQDTLINNSLMFDRTKFPEMLILTKDEKVFIKNSLNEERSFFWKPKLIDKSNLIITN